MNSTGLVVRPRAWSVMVVDDMDALPLSRHDPGDGSRRSAPERLDGDHVEVEPQTLPDQLCGAL